MLINFNPATPGHGEAALFSGAAHVRNEAFSQSILDTIYAEQVRPQLAAGHVASGIAAGLDAAAARLSATRGSWYPTRFQAAQIARGPLTLACGLAGLALVYWSIHLRRSSRGVPAIADTPSKMIEAMRISCNSTYNR
jgi:hypothetical protein